MFGFTRRQGCRFVFPTVTYQCLHITRQDYCRLGLLGNYLAGRSIQGWEGVMMAWRSASKLVAWRLAGSPGEGGVGIGSASPGIGRLCGRSIHGAYLEGGLLAFAVCVCVYGIDTVYTYTRLWEYHVGTEHGEGYLVLWTSRQSISNTDVVWSFPSSFMSTQPTN